MKMLKKNRFYILLSVIVILGIIGLLIFVYVHKREQAAKYENEFLETVEILMGEYPFISDYSISFGSMALVVAQSEQEFPFESYSSCVETIDEISSSLHKSYEEYFTNLKSLGNSFVKNISERVDFELRCATDVYSETEKLIIKNGAKYDEKNYNIDKIMQSVNDIENIVGFLYEQDTDKLEEIANNTNIRTEAIYRYANYLYYQKIDYLYAAELYSLIGNQKEVETHLNAIAIMKELQGTWKEVTDREHPEALIFNGFEVYIRKKNTNRNSYYAYEGGSYTYLVQNDGMIIVRNNQDARIATFRYTDGTILDATVYYGQVSNRDDKQYIKISDNMDFPDTIALREPEIGMSKEEVLKESTWGKPEKINTTIVLNTVHEQWCYDNDKYLYFDDGILTGIQK